MSLKRIDKDIFHLIFSLTFHKDVMRWYNTVNPWKVNNWDDMCKEFLCLYSYNADLSITSKDIELIKQEEKKNVSNFDAQWRVVVAHMANKPLTADQVKLFIKSLTTYMQHLRFMPFETLRY